MKKLFLIILAVIMAVSFCACGNSGGTDDAKIWYFNNDETDPEKIFNDVSDTVNPKQIFSSVQFDEKILQGVYAIDNIEKDFKDVGKQLSFKDIEYDNGTFSTSSLPVAVYFGTEYLPEVEAGFKQVTDRDVAALSFVVDDKIGTVPCTYEVNGNKVKFTVLTETSSSEKDFSYELDDVVFEYEFLLCGPYFTLTDGTDSLKLTAYSFTDNNKSDINII